MAVNLSSDVHHISDRFTPLFELRLHAERVVGNRKLDGLRTTSPDVRIYKMAVTRVLEARFQLGRNHMENPDREPAEAPSSLRDGQQEAEGNFRGRADLQLSQRKRKYLDALLHSPALEPNQVTSVIVCGSVVNGGFSDETSDVDLIIVLRDIANAEHRRCLHEAGRLEIEHGFRCPSTRTKNPLERFAEHAGGHAISDFICTRSDLLSGDVARVFHLRTAEKPFVARMVLASVILSAVTIWGDELLPKFLLSATSR